MLKKSTYENRVMMTKIDLEDHTKCNKEVKNIYAKRTSEE